MNQCKDNRKSAEISTKENSVHQKAVPTGRKDDEKSGYRLQKEILKSLLWKSLNIIRASMDLAVRRRFPEIRGWDKAMLEAVSRPAASRKHSQPGWVFAVFPTEGSHPLCFLPKVRCARPDFFLSQLWLGLEVRSWAGKLTGSRGDDVLFLLYSELLTFPIQDWCEDTQTQWITICLFFIEERQLHWPPSTPRGLTICSR